MAAEKTRWLNPARALTHPLWLGALVLLVVNDHLLKSGPWAGVMTGKLSDLAGLLLAPVLLAALVGVRTRRGLWLSGGAVAAVFAAINLSPELAATWDAAISLVVPFHTTVDPTDLLALPAVPLGLWLLRDRMAAFTTPPAHRLVALQGLLAAIGVAASLGSGEPGPTFWPQEAQEAQVSVFNHTRELHVLRIRYLNDGVRLDCEEVAEDPNAYLSDALFGTPERWRIQSGQQIGLRTRGADGCSAALIQTDTALDILVFWRDDLPLKSFDFDAEVPQEVPADDQTVVLEGDYAQVAEEDLKPYRFRTECGAFANNCEAEVLEPAAEIPAGARYFWHSEHDTPLHFVRPRLDSAPSDPVSDACTIPGSGQGLHWSSPPLGQVYVTRFEEGVDGCHELGFGHPDADNLLQEEGTWWVCAPRSSLELLVPAEDRRVTINVEPRQWNSPGERHEELSIQVGHVSSDVMQPDDDSRISTEFMGFLELSRGAVIPALSDLAVEFIAREGCEPQAQVCGEVLQPVQVTVDGRELSVGEPVRFGEVMRREVTLIRAARRPVAIPTCSDDGEETSSAPLAADPTLIEAVVVTGTEAL